MNKYMNSDALLLQFNNRDKSAFSDVYSLYFNELYYYSSKIFKDHNIDSEDLIQDIFVSIWSNEKTLFSSTDHLKNYLYMAIRNKFKDYSTHRKYIDDYELTVRNDEDYHLTTMVESEVYSAINEAVAILPSECAKVFKLYTEGWDVNEIAEKLNKAPSTVYNQRTLAVSILKKKLTNNKFMVLINFF